MRHSPMVSSLMLASALLLLGGGSMAADSPKLAAPLYKGAVPAILADGIQGLPADPGVFGGVKVLDCSSETLGDGSERNHGPWCFLTRDPIDKVKAFYDKAIGPMHAITGTWGRTPPQPVQGYAAYAERAWFEWDTDSGRDSGFLYTGVSLHALPPPPIRGEEAKTTDAAWEGQEAYKFYAQTRHFNGFIEAVDWFGDPSKRKQDELHALYKKHGRLEAALFQRKGPESEPVDETLRARFFAKQKQGIEQAQSALVPSQAQIAQMQQAASTPMPATQPATPEDAEFNEIMKRKPAVAKKYVALTRKLGELMQQQKYDEADAVDQELQALIDGNPELAALESKADQRAAAAGAAGQARENDLMANYAKLHDQAVWGTWLEYVGAAEKEAYFTLIVIDTAFLGTEKDYTRDRATIAKETAGTAPHQQVLGFAYDSGPQADAASSVPAAAEPPAQPQPLDDLNDAAKKGLNALKGLF